MPVLGTFALFPINRDFRAVHIQHHPLGVNPWPPPSPGVPDWFGSDLRGSRLGSGPQSRTNAGAKAGAATRSDLLGADQPKQKQTAVAGDA
jgi:hypothetical protein